MDEVSSHMKKYLIGGLCLFSTMVNGNEINVLLGGWSKHFESQENHLPQYNESHQGFGVEYHQEYRPNRYWVFGVNYLKDSYRMHAFGLAGGWQYRWQWKDIFFNSGWFLGIQSRSEAIYWHYPDGQKEFNQINRVVRPLGGFRFGMGYKNVSSNLSLLPTFKQNNEDWQLTAPVLYWQFALHFPAAQSMTAFDQLPKRLFSAFALDEKRMTVLSQRHTMKPHDY